MFLMEFLLIFRICLSWTIITILLREINFLSDATCQRPGYRSIHPLMQPAKDRDIVLSILWCNLPKTGISFYTFYDATCQRPEYRSIRFMMQPAKDRSIIQSVLCCNLPKNRVSFYPFYPSMMQPAKDQVLFYPFYPFYDTTCQRPRYCSIRSM